MVASAAELLRQNGVAGTGFRDVVEHSGTPRGSIAHHFPGGKRQLVAEAVRLSGATAAAMMRRAEEEGPSVALARICDSFRTALIASDYAAGCPVGAVAQEEWREPELRDAASEVFDEWRAIMRSLMQDQGVEKERAEDLADLTVSAFEGALLMCRIDRSTVPLDRVERLLGPMLDDASGR